jgi:hypothetical protein
MQWQFPFLHNLVSLGVFLLVLAVLVGLFPTIGLCVHLTGVFAALIRQEAAEMASKPVVEKIGHAVALGIYAICYCAFGMIAFPFFVLGWLVGKLVDAAALPECGASQ